MKIQNNDLLTYLDKLLEPDKLRDYCPNGLQVEGSRDIQRIVTGVTANQSLIDAAIAKNADAILVHHGYFWKSETPNILGMKKHRIKALLINDINLYAYHLPLDVHPKYGNNAQLGHLLQLQQVAPLAGIIPEGIVMWGQVAHAQSLDNLSMALEKTLMRKPLAISGGSHLIKTVAWCSGGGQGYIEQAAKMGVDAFFSGEISEQTVHIAREMGIHYIAAGHHATERYGVKSLGEHLNTELGLNVEFIDIDNPV